VPAEEWPAINQEIYAEIRRYEEQGAIKFTATIVLASGQKP